MPRIGSTSNSSGVYGRGYHVPAGWGAKWKAARDASATTLCEAVVVGDSLTWGQNNDNVNNYSWVQRLREDALAAGLTDGGHGYNWHGMDQSATFSFQGTEPVPYFSRTGTDPGSTFSMPYALSSNTTGETITFKTVGVNCRIWWSRFNQGGRFSYTVNGGSAVTVNSGSTEAPWIPANGAGVWAPDCLLLTAADGLTSGTNTIVITNLGGTPVFAKGVNALNDTGSAGNVPVGTYYYKVTSTTAAGESTPSAAFGPIAVTGASHTVAGSVLQATGATGYKLYRATSSGGTYGLVATVADSGSGITLVTDNTATPGAAAPSTNTAGLYATSNYVHINVEPYKANGIVWHCHGVPGSTQFSLFDVLDGSNNMIAMAELGIQWGMGVGGLGVGRPAQLCPAAAVSGVDTPFVRTVARNPKLVIFAFGTNDIGTTIDLTAPPAAPTAVDGGAGSLPAATYYYKIARVSDFGESIPSLATAGTTVSANHQVVLTMPNLFGAWNVYRSTSSGGTYSYVGNVAGPSSTFIDNTVTPASRVPATINGIGVTVNSHQSEAALANGIRLARNAGADVLVVIPPMEYVSNAITVGATFKRSFQAVAEAWSCAWVDLDVVMGGPTDRTAAGYWTGAVHGNIPGYKAWADFVWNNVLSPTALP